MKRAPFLGAAGAVVLSGCGAHHVMRALPGVAPTGPQAPSTFAGRLVHDKGEPIPADVLAHPIIGEARRFDGTTAPSGWMLARGQALNVAENRRLFSVLGQLAGNRDPATFTLPAPAFGMIVAVAGVFPASPTALAQSGRRFVSTHELAARERRLRPRDVAIQEQRAIALRDAQRFAASVPRVGPSHDVRLSTEQDARIERARGDARFASLAQLSLASRGRAEALAGMVLAGTTTLYKAGLEMASALSGAEANALLAQHDATERALRSGWAGMEHPDVQLEAGRYLMDIVFTEEQRRTMRQNG